MAGGSLRGNIDYRQGKLAKWPGAYNELRILPPNLWSARATQSQEPLSVIAGELAVDMLNSRWSARSDANKSPTRERGNLLHRRRLQFGLPVLFALMTLVALTLAWRGRQIENQRAAVAALHGVHAAVFYHAESPGFRGDIERAWFGGQRQVEYVTFRFSQPLFTEPERFAELQPHLARLSSLRRLILTGTSIGDEQLPLLTPLRQVDLIDLRNTQVTHAGIAQLKQALPGCQILHD